MFDLAYTLESYDLIATEGIKDVAKGICKKIVGVLSTLKAKLIKKAEHLAEIARKLMSKSKRSPQNENQKNKLSKDRDENNARIEEIDRQGKIYSRKFESCEDKLVKKISTLKNYLNDCIYISVDELGRHVYPELAKAHMDKIYSTPAQLDNMRQQVVDNMQISRQNERVEFYKRGLINQSAEVKDYINNEYKPLVAEITRLPDDLAKFVGKHMGYLGNTLEKSGKHIDQLIKCVQKNPGGLYSQSMVSLITTIADAGTVILQAAAAHEEVAAKVGATW